MQVVLERADRAVLVGADTNTSAGGSAKRSSTLAELEPVELGHPHVEEDRVEPVGRRGSAAPRRRCRRTTTSRHRGEPSQQAREVVERGPLVVDREHAQARPAHAARTPARNFGSVIVTVVPRPARSRSRARSRGRSWPAAAPARSASPTPPPFPASSSCAALRLHADAVVGHAQLDVGVDVAADDLDPARGRAARRRAGPRSRPAAAARAPARPPAAPRARPGAGPRAGRRSGRARGAGTSRRSGARRRASRTGSGRGTRSA